MPNVVSRPVIYRERLHQNFVVYPQRFQPIGWTVWACEPRPPLTRTHHGFLHACRVGEASHPGPFGRLRIESINVTSIVSHYETLVCRSADVTLVQEHSLKADQRTDFRDFALTHGRKTSLSGLDPTRKRPTGGVGIISTINFVKPPIRSALLLEAVETGRVDFSAIKVCQGHYLPIFNIYGYTGGHTNRIAAARTDALLAAALDELRFLPECPCLVLGDFNAEPSDLPTLRKVTGLGWTNLGASAEMWNQLPNVPTCRAPNVSGPGTVRDYIIASPMCLPLITHFAVHSDEAFATHSVLECTLDFRSVRNDFRKLKVPSSLVDLVQRSFLRKYHVVCSERAESHCTGAEWARHVDGMKQRMDAHFEAVLPLISDLCESKQTDEAWHHWALAFETSILHACDNVPGTHHYAGHGKVALSREQVSVCPKLSHDGSLQPLASSPLVVQVRKQYNRLKKLQEYVRASSFASGCESSTYMKAQDTLAAIRSAASSHIAKLGSRDADCAECPYAGVAADILCKLPDNLDVHYQRFYPSMCKLSERLLDILASRTSLSQSRTATSHHRAAITKNDFAFLKREHGLPLRCLRVVRSCGKVDFVVDPTSIDVELRAAWQPIRLGRSADASRLVQNFLRKYAHVLPKCGHCHVQPLTAESLLKAAAASNNSAAGMDGIAPAELKLMSHKAASCLALILNSVEEGAPWPQTMLCAKTAFLDKSKSPGFAAEPLQLRILTVTQAVYRLWARARLADLDPWISEWDDPRIFGGMPGRGAQDAWYSTALLKESVLMAGESLTAGSVDLMKCFDQILRPLLFALLRHSNFPPRLLCAYTSFINNISVQNSICGHVGDPHQHACGIPQGCPLSMLMVAFLMKPWVELTASVGCSPRVLADDILVAAHGTDHQRHFHHAFSLTLEYIQDIGATIAPDKSYLISTNRVTRKWLRSVTWPQVGGASIPVQSHVRDLGTHLCTTEGKASTTLAARARKAIDILSRLRRTNYSYALRAHVCRCLVLPKALYGVEACDIPVVLIEKLTASLARVTSKGSQFQFNAVMFDVASYGLDLDPYVHVLVRRASMLRRFVAKFPQSTSLVDTVIRAYQDGRFVGTCMSELETGGNPESWRLPCRGPIGLLLQSLAKFHSIMLPDYTVRHAFSLPFNLLDLPWQSLRPRLMSQCAQSRFVTQMVTRSEFSTPCHVDHDALRLALREAPQSDFRLLVSILGLGRWTERYAAKFDASLKATCQLCGEAEGGLSHLLWDCPLLAAHRCDDTCDFSIARSSDVHQLIRYGLPPLMSPRLDHDLWDDSLGGVGTRCATHDLYSHSPFVVPEYIRQYRDAVEEQMMKENVFFPSAQHFANYVRKVDVRELRAAVHEYVLAPFPAGDLCIPPTPNAFSDGSVTFPKQQSWATATFGIIHMKDIAYEEQLNSLELSFAHTCVGQRNLHGCFYSCRAPILGGGYSSSRAELAGVLLAISVRWPLHLALDNLSTVNALNDLLRSDLRPPRKPWSLMVNGDLWELVHQLLRWRQGKATTAVRWCKGHALEAHFDDGSSSPYLAWGNDMADKEAERAHQMLAYCEQLCAAYQAKQAVYVNFLVKLHAMFVRVIRAEKVLRDQRARSLPRPCLLRLPHRHTSLLQARTLSLPPCPDESTGTTFASLADSSISDQLDPHDQCVLRFLLNVRWALPGELNSLGTTWLELVVAYALCGGTLDCASTILKVPTFRQAMIEFRKRMRRLVTIVLAPQYQPCFAPYGISYVRLSCLAVATLLPGIQGKMCMPASLRDSVYGILIGAAHSFKPARVKAALLGDVSVYPNRFPLRKRADLFHSHAHPSYKQICHSSTPVFSPPARPAYFRVTCPKCNAASLDVSQRRLYSGRGWASLLCARCGKNSSATQWKCTCGVAWPSCATHQSHGYACIARQRLPPRVRRKAEPRGTHHLLRRKKRCIRQRVHPVPPGRQQDPLNLAPPNMDRTSKRACLVAPSSMESYDTVPPPTTADGKRSRDDIDVPTFVEPASTRRRQADDIVADARSRHAASSPASYASLRPAQPSLKDSLARLLQ